MSIIIPIDGAGTGPLLPVTYSSYSSAEIRVESRDPAYVSADVESEVPYEALLALSVEADRTIAALNAIQVAVVSQYPVFRSSNLVSGEGFLILADVLQQEFDDLGALGSVDINAKLLVNNTEVFIKSFNFQVPTGRLGSLLNVVLADPNTAIVPAGASIDFSLVVTIGGNTFEKLLMSTGKLQERDYTISYKGGKTDGPQDEVTFGALDVLADRFTLAPRRSVVLYDPSRVKYDEVTTSSENAVRDERGGLIYPILEPVTGLTMKQILARAYTLGGGLSMMTTGAGGYSSGLAPLISNPGTDQIGCGFTSVITNIPNYRVQRADFTLEAGWHDGATPCVAMYGPLYFVEGTRLFIIDPDRVLPYGAAPHLITLSDHKNVSQRIAFKPDANAVLLTYQYASNDPAEDSGRLSREVFVREIDEAEGLAPGDPGYYRILTQTWNREYYFAENPTEVLATFPISVDIETQQTVEWHFTDDGTISSISYGTYVTHKETTHYIYEGEFLVNTSKIVQGLIMTGGYGSLIPITLEQEEIHVIWKDDPFTPGVKLQDKVITNVYGVVAYSDVEETVTTPGGPVDGMVRRYAALDAQAGSIIKVDSIDSTLLVPVKTIRESLHHLSGKQYNVSVVELDCLNNTVRRSYSQPVTGSTAADQYGSKSRVVLFRDLISEADIGPRIPVPVNAFELPRKRAFELARNALKRIKNPLMQMPIELPSVDFAIARGSIVQAQKRNGTYTSKYFVTGYSINGVSLGHTGHRISQSLEAIELLTP
jgi:hypothetical protein